MKQTNNLEYPNKTFQGWDDLRVHGILALTGESCNASMRILCDLTPQGITLLTDFLGGTVEVKPGSNWNSADGQTGSIMLAYELVAPLSAFVLLYRLGCEYAVVYENGHVHGMSEAEFLEDNNAPHRRPYKRIWHRSSHPGTGGRNTHQMSGRLV